MRDGNASDSIIERYNYDCARAYNLKFWYHTSFHSTTEYRVKYFSINFHKQSFIFLVSVPLMYSVLTLAMFHRKVNKYYGKGHSNRFTILRSLRRLRRSERKSREARR